MILVTAFLITTLLLLVFAIRVGATRLNEKNTDWTKGKKNVFLSPFLFQQKTFFKIDYTNGKYFLFVLITLLSFQNAWTQEEKKDTLSFCIEQSDSTIFKTLANEKVEKLYIKTNIKALLKGKKNKEPKYQSASLSFDDGINERQEWDINVRVRGERRKEYCSFPPVKIKFPKEKLEALGFQPDYNDIKIVTHCKKHAKSKDYLMREFLAYKMYNLLTDYSFRVKLLEIEYIDTKKKVKSKTAYAFLIENTDEMANRLGGVEYLEPTFYLQHIKNEITALQDVFQYMIGNTDYKIEANHNIKMVKKNNSNTLFPVPYDFDYCGLVSTSYSTPAEGIKAKSVRERFFLGYCESDETWEKVFQIFLDHETEIFKLVKDFKHLKKYSKKFITQYLKSFYRTLKNDSSRHFRIIEKCK